MTIRDNELAEEIDKLIEEAELGDPKTEWSVGAVKLAMFMTIKFLEKNYILTKKEK